jgi:hypothetical protein
MTTFQLLDSGFQIAFLCISSHLMHLKKLLAMTALGCLDHTLTTGHFFMGLAFYPGHPPSCSIWHLMVLDLLPNGFESHAHSFSAHTITLIFAI